MLLTNFFAVHHGLLYFRIHFTIYIQSNLLGFFPIGRIRLPSIFVFYCVQILLEVT
jgi:hypothetical protein